MDKKNKKKKKIPPSLPFPTFGHLDEGNDGNDGKNVTDNAVKQDDAEQDEEVLEPRLDSCITFAAEQNPRTPPISLEDARRRRRRVNAAIRDVEGRVVHASHHATSAIRKSLQLTFLIAAAFFRHRIYTTTAMTTTTALMGGAMILVLHVSSRAKEDLARDKGESDDDAEPDQPQETLDESEIAGVGEEGDGGRG